MGPKISQIKGKKTIFLYELYQLAGMSNSLVMMGKATILEPSQTQRWKRILVITAGPVMNFLLAILLLAMFFTFLESTKTLRIYLR